MATITRFEDIQAWQKARALNRTVYEATSSGRFSRDFGLRDQIQRASVSVMANIAEGFERDNNAEFIQFLSIAKASAAEVLSHLYAAKDVGYLEQEHFVVLSEMSTETMKCIAGLMNYLRRSQTRGLKYKQTAEAQNTKPETRN